jgi:two-component system, NarL family, sensor histidine kinase EvgS
VDLYIDVTDTGIGIAPENQQRIFEAFKQQDSQDARKYGGTGLGLAITRRLVEMLNGNIELQSTPGEGSTFSVVLRQVETADDSFEIRHEANEYKIGKIIFAPQTILIADDVPINREFLKNVFKGSNITFLEAENGEEAIDLIKRYRPRLALLDLRMPVVDGLTVAQYIKTNDKYKDIAVIGISATLISYDIDFRSIYLDDFISKPVDISDLLKKISQYIPVLRSKVSNTATANEKPGNFFVLRDKQAVQQYQHVFKEEILPVLLKLSNTSSFSDYDKFSKILILKGDELKIKPLTFIGHSIAEASKSFDLDAIVKLVEEFKNFTKTVLIISNEQSS